MKKKGLLLVLLSFGLLGGCETGELYYQGTLRTIPEIEDMLEDYLESENPMHKVKVEIADVD